MHQLNCRAAWLAGLAVLLAGCQVEVQGEGTSCTTAADCLVGYSCVESHCHASDGGSGTGGGKSTGGGTGGGASATGGGTSATGGGTSATGGGTSATGGGDASTGGGTATGGGDSSTGGGTSATGGGSTATGGGTSATGGGSTATGGGTSATGGGTATGGGSGTVKLTVSTTGPGAITSAGTINCGSTCSANYALNTVVTLTAAPQGSSTFSWGGACAGILTNTCTITMDAAKNVSATFVSHLTVALSGTGLGTVASTPLGISCGATCSADFSAQVSLTATPDVTSMFVGWTGACTGTTNPCVLTPPFTGTATAQFDHKPVSITMVAQGNGQGAITQTFSAGSCANCSIQVPYNSSVTFTATPATAPESKRSVFKNWSGGCTGATCTITAKFDVAVYANFELVPNVGFISSSTTAGNFGGIAGGNKICQDAADAAKLPGTYHAFLATDTLDVISQFTGASGWVNTKGEVVANTAASLVTGALLYPLRYDETGKDLFVDGPAAWTGCSPTGTHSTFSCDAFTSAASGKTGNGGVGTFEGPMFTTGSAASCDTLFHLFCFGVDRAANVTVPTISPSRLAFITTTNFTPNGGLAGADTMCNDEAGSHGLPANFFAMLATDGTSPASRFNTAGAPWVRNDGVPIAATAFDFFNAAAWIAPIDVALDGSRGELGWTGASTTDFVTNGTAASTCSSWGSANTGTGGVAVLSSPKAGNALAGLIGCGNRYRLICLEK